MKGTSACRGIGKRRVLESLEKNFQLYPQDEEDAAELSDPDPSSLPDDVWDVFSLDDVEGDTEPEYGDFWPQSEDEECGR